MTRPPRLLGVVASGNRVGVRWSDGIADVVTPLWLRDACHCAACRIATGGQRLVDMATVPGDLSVGSLEVSDDRLEVAFGDGHRGVVPIAVLALRRPRRPVPRWGAEHAARLRRESTAWGDDLGGLLTALDEDGVALARDVPVARGAVLEFARRIGFVRETNYGEMFDVVARSDPANLADSREGLPVHTDNPYRDPVPTVQLLHCLVATDEGGATRLVDGFGAAERLAVSRPDAFAVLTRHDVPFRFVDGTVDLRAAGPVIELDAVGDLRGVRVNSRSMAPPDLTAAELDAFYDAYGAFVDVLADTDHVVELMLRPGELLALDNRRVLHGRSPYPAGTHRLLQGCYVDIDAVRSAVLVARAGT